MNLKYVFIAAGLCLFSFAAVHAQQDPLYGLYLNNPLLINPAYAGLNDAASAGIVHRSQWAGLEGSPTTTAVNFHTSLNQNQTGAGLVVLNDKTGPAQSLEIAGAYSYRIHFEQGTLSMGLQAGLYTLQNDYSTLLIRDPDVVFEESEKLARPNFGAGALFVGRRFIAGLSAPRLMKYRVDAGAGKTLLYNRHFYAMAGGVFHLNERAVFRPFVYLRQVKGAPLSYDVRADFFLNELAMAGLYTRSFNQFGFTVGLFPQKKFRAVYQYEMPLSAFDSPFSSHEISLAVDLTLFSFHKQAFRYF